MLKDIFIELLKKSVFYVAIIGAVMGIAGMIDYKERFAKWMVSSLADRGYLIDKVSVETLSPFGIELKEVQMRKPWRFTADSLRLNVLTTTVTVEQLALQDIVRDTDAVLRVKARLKLHDDGKVVWEGKADGSPNNLSTRFFLSRDMAINSIPQMWLQDVAFSYAGGQISAEKFNLSKGDAQRIEVVFNGLSIEHLLRSMLDPEVKATGTVSGSLPLTMSPDGVMNLEAGRLVSQESGTLNVPKRYFADNADMKTVALALSHFVYDELKIISLPSSQGGRMRLELSGHSPHVLQGQKVNLSVNLSGNVILFVTQRL